MTLRLESLRVGATTIDLEAPAGSLVALVGDSSDATPMLEAIAGLRKADAGSATLGGLPVDPARTGIALADHPLVGALTAAENVELRLLALGLPADRDAVDGLLGAMLLPEAIRDNLVEQLSGGQQQRVAVARALAGAPALICLDDPASELDGTTAEAVHAALLAAAEAGAIVVVASAEPVPAATHRLRLDRRR